MRTDEDMHVHSTFSDGKGTISENVAAAEYQGLRRLGCVDHVRRDTTWVPHFVHAIRTEQKNTRVRLFACVEAKFLDENGTLDLPEQLEGIDAIYAADHQFPLGAGVVAPGQIKQALENGDMSIDECTTTLTNALCRSMERNPKLVIAHMFSILPKVGVPEHCVTMEQLTRIAQVARLTHARVEFDERWCCPGPRSLRVFQDLGVEILCSSDAHIPKKIGKYTHAQRIRSQLRLPQAQS